MTDYTKLKRLADAAKNWGGEVGEHRWYTAECFKHPYFSVPDAEFIAACDPGKIRSLIAENDHLAMCARQWEEAAMQWAAERDQAKAEIAGLKTGYEAYERVNAELKAEVEGLRKDAERFRRMRAMTLAQIDDTQDEFDAEFDRQLDAAMGKGEQS